MSAKQVLIPEQMPDFLSNFPPLIQRIKAKGAFASSKHGEPNHCVSVKVQVLSISTQRILDQLVNEYEPGQGIMVSTWERQDARTKSDIGSTLQSHMKMEEPTLQQWPL